MTVKKKIVGKGSLVRFRENFDQVRRIDKDGFVHFENVIPMHVSKLKIDSKGQVFVFDERSLRVGDTVWLGLLELVVQSIGNDYVRFDAGFTANKSMIVAHSVDESFSLVTI